MERSDDEILERGNRTAKRIKHDLLFFGGSSDPTKSKVTRVAFKPDRDAEGKRVEESYVAEESTRKRVPGQGEQFARLMPGRKALLAERKQCITSECKLQLAEHKHSLK
eukprot:189383-Pleurochrysis_carterae.AAC.1